MTLDHASARNHAIAGFRAEFGRDPSTSERQCLQAIGALESGYGTWWKGAGVGSFNMGAIWKGSDWKGPTFQYQDSRPARPDDPPEQVKNGQFLYVAPYRKYASAAEGWRDLASVVYGQHGREEALAAAASGDTREFSAVLYKTKYYAGTASTVSGRIDAHHGRVMKYITEMASALREPLPSGELPPPPTLQRGDSGEDVKELQHLLGLVADGQFGPITEAAVKERQFDLGLKPDGEVGPLTWAALLAGGPPKQVPDIPDTEPAPPPAGPSPALSLARIVLSDTKRLVDLLEEA